MNKSDIIHYLEDLYEDNLYLLMEAVQEVDEELPEDYIHYDNNLDGLVENLVQ
jgi:hypothetical protein